MLKAKIISDKRKTMTSAVERKPTGKWYGGVAVA